MPETQNMTNMTTTRTMSSFFRIFLAIDSLFVVYFIFMDDYLSLLNSQIGALSAMAVAMGSYVGYRSSVKKQVHKFEGMIADERDMLDKIDDTYDLFDEEEINYEEISSEEAKNIFKEEKEKLKKKSTIKNLALSFKSIFSPLRVAGYILLVIGFFWLEGNSNLKIVPYFLGLSILPISSIVTAFKR